jgi:ABC-type phosphate transport system substrate-binding protein
MGEQEKWVDIGAPKKNGKYQPCGRSKGSKRKYPKCVPLAKATRMTKSQKASAVKRKRQASNTGPKPTNVKTVTKRVKKANGGYIGSFIKLDVDGKTVGNPS